jgi:hypothetical protein
MGLNPLLAKALPSENCAEKQKAHLDDLLTQYRRSYDMTWHCISPPHSEDVKPAARYFIARGVTRPETIRHNLPRWDEESIQAVIHEIERLSHAKQSNEALQGGIQIQPSSG